MDRERLIQILRDYPGITHVSTKSGALALKFADGTTVDMNPNHYEIGRASCRERV